MREHQGESEPTAFGRLLRAAIDAHRPKLHSSRAAAIHVGISPTQISNYLRGETLPTHETAGRIAGKLNMNMADVLRTLPAIGGERVRIVDQDQLAAAIAARVVQELRTEIGTRSVDPEDPLLEEKENLVSAIYGIRDHELLDNLTRTIAESRAEYGADAPDD